MYTFFATLLLFGGAALLLWSCEKKEDRTVLREGAAPMLTASKTTLTLDQSKAGDTAVEISWNTVDYGFRDAIGYSLQIAKAGTNFTSASTTEIAVTKANLKKVFTVEEINKELIKILPAGTTSQVELRLKSSVGEIYSNTIKMTVTPYKSRILYTFPQAINVAGNFQSWSPGAAPQIVSMANNGQYEGFIDFGTTGTPEFKFVKGNDWPAGDYGGAGAGKLGNGGSNLTLSSGGIYLIKANTTALTWSSVKINSFGIIGDAVPTTGWGSDRDMTYDAVAKVWTITLDLIGGKHIKFRANDAWDVNLGDKGNDGVPELGVDDNIPVASSGNYTVTLDVLVGGNWSYTLKKN